MRHVDLCAEFGRPMIGRRRHPQTLDSGQPGVPKNSMLQRSMMTNIDSLAILSHQELLAKVKTLASNERRATAQLIASLAELDARRLYLAEGCSSLFTYCTQVLQLSEHAAYGRIEAARASRFLMILDLLDEGAITLTTVGLLAPHLTPENHLEVLADARHKSKRAVEEIVARLRPASDVPATIRRLPQPIVGPALDPARPSQLQGPGESVREEDVPAPTNSGNTKPSGRRRTARA
jgi:hypothetical protein